MELTNYNRTYTIDNIKFFNIIHTSIAATLFVIIITLSIITAIITKKSKHIKDIKDIKDKLVTIDKNVATILRVIKELKKLD